MDYKSMTDTELAHHALQAERDLTIARLGLGAGRPGVLRKNVARAHTELRRRELAQGLAKDALLNAGRGTFQPAAAGAVGGGGDFLAGVAEQFDAE